MRIAASVGRTGTLALIYFTVMSTVALAIGLVVGNILQPGSNLEITTTALKKGPDLGGKGAESTTDFLISIIPDTLVSSLT